MPEIADAIVAYGIASGFSIRSRTVLVEGTSDVDLFRLAADLEREVSGVELLGNELAIVAAGVGDLGGTHGVIRELITLRGMARLSLLPSGRPRYRIVGLFDNDKAGRAAVREIRRLDTSILEYKDIFHLWPSMPVSGNLDPGALKKAFERDNDGIGGMEWEIEDMFPGSFYEAFLSEWPTSIRKTMRAADKVHRDFTPDGKARFHRFVKCHALHQDMSEVIMVLRALRCYLGLQS